MQYHVGRNGKQLGQFTKDQLQAGLQDGTLDPSDLVWTDGMPNWLPMKEALPELVNGMSPPPLKSVEVIPPSIPNHPLTGQGTYGSEAPATGLATSTLVIGILSLCCCQIASVAGVVIGHMALNEIHKSNGNRGGKGIATVGLVLSYIGLALLLISLIVPMTVSEETMQSWQEKIEQVIEEAQKNQPTEGLEE